MGVNLYLIPYILGYLYLIPYIFSHLYLIPYIFEDLYLIPYFLFIPYILWYLGSVQQFTKSTGSRAVAQLCIVIFNNQS